MLEHYLTFIIIGKSKHLPWEWAGWQRILPELDRLISLVNGKVGVRSVQGGISNKNKDVKFGALAWNESSHKEWTHNSPVTKQESRNWKFSSTEVWAPHWRECEKESSSPSLFIRLENPFTIDQPKTGQFNQLLQVSIEATLYQLNSTMINSLIQDIATKVESVLILTSTSPWIVRSEALQDALINKIEYTNIHKELVPDPSKMRGEWRIFNPSQGFQLT